MRLALAMALATLLWHPALRAQPAEAPAAPEVRPDPPAVLAGAEHLKRAVALLDVPDYAGALIALDAGLAAPGNSRETLVALHELRGFVLASLRETAGALESFQRVLVLAPDFQPSRGYSPRVRGPYLEARAWLADHAPLRFTPLPPQGSGNSVKRVGAVVLSDPLKLARKIRFHLRNPRDAWVKVEVPLAKSQAQAELQAPGTGWWAELLGERDAVLSRIGSAEKPILEGSLALTALEARSKAIKPHHLASVAMIGGGVVAASAGAWFGVQSTAHADRIRSAAQDPLTGRVTGLTQREAFELERRSKGEAILANVLFASAVALAAGGVGTFVFGDRLVVSPAGIKGTFP